MENASKALIIAGAILLSILIIGLGMMIYTQAEGIASGDQIKSQEIQTRNRQFTQYDGVQSGTTVRQIISSIASYNIATAEDSSQFVTVIAGDASEVTSNEADDDVTAAAFNSANVNPKRSTIKAGKNYKVSFGYDATTGYVIAVGFVEVTTN